MRSLILDSIRVLTVIHLLIGCQPNAHTVHSGSKVRLFDGERSPKSVQLFRSEPELIADGFGYDCELHEVTTEDGYILSLHRIPKGRKLKRLKEPRPVVLVLPGFLASSHSWLFRGPGKDLPYVFAEADYDTWIINSRGNVFSRKHESLNPDADPKFWNFSIHEYGLYDLPAAIDYTLKVTNQSAVYFLGHSIGATAAFIMCASRPDYNAKVKMINALAPAAIISHPASPFMQFLLSLLPPLVDILRNRGVLEMFPQKEIFWKLGDMLCSDQAITQGLCLHLMFSAVGTDYEQFNNSMLPTALKYYPAGTSVDVVTHVHEIFSGHFKPLNVDHNHTMYYYDLSKVTVPVALHYGDGDTLVTKKDNEILGRKLGNTVGIFRVPHPQFNHIDFMWSSDSKILLYDHLISLMKKYK